MGSSAWDRRQPWHDVCRSCRGGPRRRRGGSDTRFDRGSSRLSGMGITNLAGEVVNAGTTRIVSVGNITATKGALVGELRGALPNVLNAARAEGVQTLQISATFANPGLRAFAEHQAARYGGAFASAGGRRPRDAHLPPGSTLMTVLVYSVVRRHMKHTSPGSFTRYEDGAVLPMELSPSPDETIIGWYRNPAPWQDAFIAFTSQALYIIEAGRIDRISVAEIVGYEDPKFKTEVTGVRILTKDGFRFVRIAGSFGPSGSQKDAYSFIMVLRALIPGAGLHPHAATRFAGSCGQRGVSKRPRRGCLVSGPKSIAECLVAHQELKRAGVTLQLLWVEYQEAARAKGAEPYC